MSEKPTTNPLIDLAEDTAALMSAGQSAALSLLQAEIRAIGAILGALPDEDAETAAARRRAEEAAVEEGFDNMPV
ncbi:MAG: hypothetical protein IAE87_11375 [Rhodobacteraceae bacterium]|jgi:alpha-D-ribose 1-methylphosphonate 5-triphosphate synthase subunit PhnL|nr:hypothetical protein [Paracoccaceae bacterium]